MLNLGYTEGLPRDAFQMPNLVTPHSWSPPPPITFLRQVNFSFLSPHSLWHGFNTINLGPRFSRSVSKNKLNNFIVHSGKQGRKERQGSQLFTPSRQIHTYPRKRSKRKVCDSVEHAGDGNNRDNNDDEDDTDCLPRS